jgi:hypothetical protein
MKLRRVKTKKKCCKSRPRCRRCPVVCKRLEQQDLAIRESKFSYLVSLDIKKKTLKAARA